MSAVDIMIEEFIFLFSASIIKNSADLLSSERQCAMLYTREDQIDSQSLAYLKEVDFFWGGKRERERERGKKTFHLFLFCRVSIWQGKQRGTDCKLLILLQDLDLDVLWTSFKKSAYHHPENRQVIKYLLAMVIFRPHQLTGH